MSAVIPAEAASADSAYAAMDPSAAATAQDAVEKIRGIQRRMVADVVEIGSTLIRVKHKLDHGQFLPWLRIEFGWTERSAQNYMAAAERFGTNTKLVSHLPMATVYRLAAPSTPDDVRARIVGALHAGNALSPAEIDDQIRSARREADHERERAKKSPQALAKLKAVRERRARDYAVAEAERHERREREAAAQREAADIIVAHLPADEIERLVGLLTRYVSVRREDILEARVRGGAS